jgi:hypothetical protein
MKSRNNSGHRELYMFCVPFLSVIWLAKRSIRLAKRSIDQIACQTLKFRSGHRHSQPDGKSCRVSVQGGVIFAGNMQEILSSSNAGQQVVSNVLALQNTVDQ